MYLGEMLEFNSTTAMFAGPVKKQTKDYLSGLIG
jgi:ABC-type phosphate transport system ATPase subunit